MFQRVQQLLLAGRNRNRAKRGAKHSGSPGLYKAGRSRTAGRHRTTSATRSFFLSFPSSFLLHILFFEDPSSPLVPFKRYAPVRTHDRSPSRKNDLVQKMGSTKRVRARGDGGIRIPDVQNFEGLEIVKVLELSVEVTAIPEFWKDLQRTVTIAPC